MIGREHPWGLDYLTQEQPNEEWRRIAQLVRESGALVVKSGQDKHLPPMGSLERRTAHMAAKAFVGVESHSEGQKRKRHVVIGPDPAKWH